MGGRGIMKGLEFDTSRSRLPAKLQFAKLVPIKLVWKPLSWDNGNRVFHHLQLEKLWDSPGKTLLCALGTKKEGLSPKGSHKVSGCAKMSKESGDIWEGCSIDFQCSIFTLIVIVYADAVAWFYAGVLGQNVVIYWQMSNMCVFFFFLEESCFWSEDIQLLLFQFFYIAMCRIPNAAFRRGGKKTQTKTKLLNCVIRTTQCNSSLKLMQSNPCLTNWWKNLRLLLHHAMVLC